MHLDPCKTCGCDMREVTPRKRKTCAGIICRTNIKYGKALEDMGWDLGDEALWKKKRICSICEGIVSRWVTARRKIEVINCDWRERTGVPAPSIAPRKQPSIRISKKSQLISSLQASKYGSLFRNIKEVKAARHEWLLDIKKTIRAEMRGLEQDECLFLANSAENGSGKLEWDVILEKIQNKAPVLYTVFFAAMSKLDDPKRCFKTVKWMKSRLGMMFLIPLHHRKPRYHRIPRYLPLTFARTLFKCDTPLKRVPLKKDLQSTRGVPCGISGFTQVRAVKPDSIVSSWRTTIEEEKTSTTGSLLAGADMHPGYSLVIDSTREKPQRLPVCNAFAVKNRVSFRGLQEDTTVKASDLPLKTYLPNQKDYDELRMRMRVLVERILKANLDVFSYQSTLEHIPHQYSKECSQKSEYVVDLRLIDDQENPKGSEGMLKILTRLSELVPKDYDMPLHGDQEAMSMVRSARKTASKDPTSKNHNNLLHPVPQDLRAVIVRDTMADLFSPTQATEKGTLRHLQEFFGLRSVDNETSSFHHTDEFLLFIACAFVVGFATEILQKSRRSKSKPRLGPIADEIVRRIWYQLPMNRVADILNAPVEDHDDQFCFCKEDVEEANMVECCNIDCPNGRWFHQDCVMEVEAEGEWFCGFKCEQSQMGQFCVCRQKEKEEPELTWSCANESCQRGKHFHNRCVRATLPEQHDDEWYCSAECSGSEADKRDELMDYLQRVTWCSLFSECIRDAEREGDGIASMAYWRISMPELFARGHDQHVAVTHRLLAGTAGCFPPRIREEVIHNRTMNLHGGKGKNISLDFSTEQLDNAKEAPRSKQGKKPQSKQKAGKASSKRDVTSTERFARYQDDVKKFLDNFGDMFCEMKGRIVPSLCGKIVGREITQEKASDMKKRLLKLNKKFDKELRVKHRLLNPSR